MRLGFGFRKWVSLVGLVSLVVFSLYFFGDSIHAQAERSKDTVVAVLIGINAYKSKDINPLAYSERDAEGLYQALTGPGKVAKENVVKLTSKNATRKKIVGALQDWLPRRVKALRASGSQVTVIVFFAGHGVQDQGISYWLPYDAQFAGEKINTDTGISHERFQMWLSPGWLGSQRIVIFVDACHSGFAWSRKGFRSMLKQGQRKTLPPPASWGEGFVTIASSTQDQESVESDVLRHGIFSYALIKGLEGQADYNNDGVVTLPELWAYLSDQVSPLAMKYKNHPQVPVKTGPEAGPIAMSFPSRHALPQAAPDAPTTNKGQILLQSEPPGAMVLLGSILEGQTPVTLTLPASVHEIEIVLEGHEPLKRKIRIRADQKLSWIAALQKLQSTQNVGTSEIEKARGWYQKALRYEQSKSYTEAFYFYRKAAEAGHKDAQNSLGLAYANGRIVPQNYKEALLWFQKAAAQDLPISQSNLGFLYANGLGIEKNEATAIAWFRKAAEKNEVNSQNFLGFMYEQGRGVSKDEKQAAFWYQKAAEQGLPLAQSNLGNLYARGIGVPQDYPKALFWIGKAVEQGLAEAQNNLGLMYYRGQGLKKDPIQAARLWKKASLQNHAAASFNLAFLYEAEGERVEAMRLYKQAADLGDEAAKKAYERLQKAPASSSNSPQGGRAATPPAAGDPWLDPWTTPPAGRPTTPPAARTDTPPSPPAPVQPPPSEPPPPPTPEQAQAWFQDASRLEEAKQETQAATLYKKAADAGHAEAQNALGYFYANGIGGLAKDEKQALQWYWKAAVQGLAKAQANVAFCFHYGWGIKADAEQAIEWWKKAAEQGHAESQNWLGLSFFRGKGVPQSYAKAAVWWKKAAEQGHPNGNFNLGVLYEKGAGLPKSKKKAILHYKVAAEKGNADAKEALARLQPPPRIRGGRGRPQEAGQAQIVAWFQQAVHLQSTGQAAQAAALYKRCSKAGYAPAQNQLAGMYLSGEGVPRDLKKAVELYKKAAASGDSGAQMTLGVFYEKGIAVPRNERLAIQMFQRSADQGNAESMYRLALYHEKKGDLRKAFRYHVKAAGKGHEQAKAAVLRIHRTYNTGD